MGRRSFLPGVLACVLLVAGCNMETVQRQSVDEGVSRTFGSSHPQVIVALIDSLRELRFDMTGTEDAPTEMAVLFVRPVSGSQWGGAGRAVIQKDGQDSTKVTVNYTRRFGITGAGPETLARTLFARMDGKLAPPSAQ
jgi:hypothetical protein